jgi:hypothetical protein
MEEIDDSFGEERKETPKAEEQKEYPEAGSKANLYFLIGVGVIILLFIAIFSLKFFAKSEAVTIDDMIARTLAGDENPETNYLYNGFVFVKVGPLWYTKWKVDNYMVNVPLHFGPLELEDVSAEGQLDERFDTGSYYITFDPNGTDLTFVALSIGELGRNLVEGLGAKIASACYQNHTVCVNRSIITCENTNSSVIYVKEAEEPKIVRQGNCLILQGKGEELLKATDRAILQMYGIMK